MKVRQQVRMKLRDRVGRSAKLYHHDAVDESSEALQRRLRKFAELTRDKFLTQLAAGRAYEAAHPEIRDITVLAGPIRRNPRHCGNT
jgi:hypothetical protein